MSASRNPDLYRKLKPRIPKQHDSIFDARLRPISLFSACLDYFDYYLITFKIIQKSHPLTVLFSLFRVCIFKQSIVLSNKVRSFLSHWYMRFEERHKNYLQEGIEISS